MSKAGQNPAGDDQQESTKGPSLVWMYGLLTFALLLAIGFAALIVLPFYNRR